MKALFEVRGSSGAALVGRRPIPLIPVPPGSAKPARRFEVRTSSGRVFAYTQISESQWYAAVSADPTASANLTTAIPLAASVASDVSASAAIGFGAAQLAASVSGLATAWATLDVTSQSTLRQLRRYEIRTSSGRAQARELRAGNEVVRVLLRTEAAWEMVMPSWLTDPGWSAMFGLGLEGSPPGLQAQGLNIDLATNATGAAAALATLTTAIRMSGAVIAQNQASASMVTAINAAATARGDSTATASLVTAIPLEASALGSATATASLLTEEAGQILAAAICDAQALADLTTAIYLEAVTAASASASAELIGGAPFPLGIVMIVMPDDDDMDVPADADEMEVPMDSDEMVVI